MMSYTSNGLHIYEGPDMEKYSEELISVVPVTYNNFLNQISDQPAVILCSFS